MAANKTKDDCLSINLVTHKYTLQNNEIKNGDGNFRTHFPLSPGFPEQRNKDKKWTATMVMVAKNDSDDKEIKYKYLFELGATSKPRSDISKACYQIKVYTQRRNGTVQYIIASFKGDAKITGVGVFTVKETFNAVDLLTQVEKNWGSPELCIEFQITEVKKKRGSADADGKSSSAKKGKHTGPSNNSTIGTRSKFPSKP